MSDSASPRVSFSKSGLLLSGCTYWARPDSKWYDEELVERDTSKRDIGTAVHAGVDHGLKTGDYRINGNYGLEAQAMVDYAMEYVQQVLAPRSAHIQSEVCVGINWSTGEAEVFEDVKGRNYPDKPGWCFGTADILCFLKDGSLLVLDWKTGGTEGAQEQLLSLAAAFRKAIPIMGDDGSESLREVRISCAKLYPDHIEPEERYVSESELETHIDAMRFASESVLDTSNRPNPGIHCTQLYCPHLAYCTAVTGIIDTQATEDGSKQPPLLAPEALLRGYRMTDRPTSPEEAGYVMARCSAAKRQIDYYTSAMKKYCSDGGKVYCGTYEWKERGKQGFRWGKR